MNEDLKTGIAIALCSRGRRFAKREPVAFLYGHVAKEGETPTQSINGVDYVGWIGPDIYIVYTPELQKSHPHAYISLGLGVYILCLSPVPVIKHTDSGITVPQDAGTVTWMLSNSIVGYPEWKQLKEREQYYGKASLVSPFWGNTDIYSEDGSQYLDSIKPIPIYEQEE